MNEERKILSVQELLHLQSDKHTKDDVMPDVDTSKYVLQQKQKTTVHNFAPIVKISDEQRRQFSQGNSAQSHDAILAEQARHAIELAEKHAKEEAVEHKKIIKEKSIKSTEEIKEIKKELKAGNLEFGFGALIGGAENLKETI